MNQKKRQLHFVDFKIEVYLYFFQIKAKQDYIEGRIKSNNLKTSLSNGKTPNFSEQNAVAVWDMQSLGKLSFVESPKSNQVKGRKHKYKLIWFSAFNISLSQQANNINCVKLCVCYIFIDFRRERVTRRKKHFNW